MPERIKPWTPIVTSVVASLIVGLFSAYLTGQALIVRLETRLERTEADVARLDREIKAQAAYTASVNERLIRLETKIDVLISGARP